MEITLPDEEYEEFEARHISQLAAAAVPSHFWRRLCEKLVQETFDAGAYFQILAEETEQGSCNYSVVALKDLDVNDPNNIFLIDHAWTFRPQVARQHLREIPGLLDRLCAVFDIEEKENSDTESFSDYGGSGCEEDVKRDESGQSNKSPSAEDSVVESVTTSPLCGSLYGLNGEELRINEVLKRMWQHISTYTVRFADKEPDESDMPLWYMPDEFGVRIGHSEHPNFRMVPMFYSPQNAAYSLLFPLRNVRASEVVTRDFVDNCILRQRSDWRPILMHPWSPVDLSANKLEHLIAPDEFFTDGRAKETLPPNPEGVVPQKNLTGGKIRVFSDNDQLLDRLKTVQVERVNKIENADVIWMRKHFYDFKGLYEKNPNALVNQFPYESVLTVKDLLAACIQSVYRDAEIDEETMNWPPSWFETTFNLNTELPQFIAYFQQRALRGKDNTWIVKPWNLARGLDMHVTDNLSYIIRLIESGPKIACKYIHRPVLFRRPDSGCLVKFDLRYIVFVKSFRPLEIYLYDKFWIRFAVNDFDLSELDDRETHLTVFNYTDKSKILDMKCEDFVNQLEKMYNNFEWNCVQSKINNVIREAFETVSRGNAPRAVVPNSQSRAMYGIDIMLKWNSDEEQTRSVDVSLIEVNFMPDCERACSYYDDFADVAFKTLFTDSADMSELTRL